MTAEQRRLAQEVAEFAATRVRPGAEARSRDQVWDAGLWREFGARRWPGVVIPAAYGGLGGGALEHALIVEGISRVDASLGAALNLLQQTVMAILSFATEAQKARYLPLLADGRSYSITGITESDSGSKLEDMQTRAVRDGDGWVIDGCKTEVHIPEHVQICLVFAKTPSGIGAFLVDTGNPGFKVTGRRDIVGLRGLPMAAVAFERCRVPGDALLGAENGAYDVFFKSFDLTRIGNAAKCVGIADGALDDAIAYARRRRIGGNVVTDFQGLRWQIADLDTRVHGARALLQVAADEYTRTGRSTAASARAKLLASTTAMEAATVALQVTGSHGCFADNPFARYMMDAKVSQITGGTIEILRNAIARDRLGKPTAPTP
ncbi:acyl-CoA dehydrogenase family protein [Pigmentiphaga soli]|uniref:acyl-CoA dehydrogenase family protein n=1 Tax=Pigmentiphaga soli TaxID=1007095 RepID=UPI0031EEDA34